MNVNDLSFENVESFEVINWNEYEENIEFEMEVVLKNGEKIELSGYNGLWEMLSYDMLKDNFKVEFWNNMREWYEFVIECNS